MKTTTIVIALILLVVIAVVMVFAPEDCASIIRKYESANPSFLPQSELVRERYEGCKRGG